MKSPNKDPEAFKERRLGLGVDPREKLPKIIPEFERENVVVLPTDTIYGISCRWDSRPARDRVQQLKGPDRLAFFVSLICDKEMAFRYAHEPSPECREILDSSWPGPVTVILRLKEHAAPEFCGSPEGTIAFRLPNSPFLQELVRGVGVPIVSTSANLTGTPHAESAEEAWNVFGEGVDLYVDAVPQEGPPSTLVDLTGEHPKLLRVGIQALRGLTVEGDPYRE
ncbi:MAG: threonylcarbamoyl-AMP synthase [Candidatus Eisenbacteria bacterium]|uniref:L-threonylcarbamoyladenylate synthase n=1 Tax=Eiseniibacteriota bacterium TaxID=2212470 RepID=A0A956RQB1_UNCEI|nr:threonylcarbamoyl-AMP synthase [Candidatus Eisenbacteria bacterium]